MKVVKSKPYLLFTKCKIIIFVLLVKPSIISFVWELRMVHLFLLRLVWNWALILIYNLNFKPLLLYLVLVQQVSFWIYGSTSTPNAHIFLETQYFL